MKFIYSYGFEGHPFSGGWTEVIAPSRAEADKLFRYWHPDKTPGFLNCCTVYEEAEFKDNRMAKNGNYGSYCQEVLGNDIEMGVVVTTDNTIYIKGFTKPLSKSVGAIVGGVMDKVKSDRLPNGLVFFVNGNYMVEGLPVNEVGCHLYGTMENGHPVCGNIVIMAMGTVEGERTAIGLSTGEAQRIVSAYKTVFNMKGAYINDYAT